MFLYIKYAYEKAIVDVHLKAKEHVSQDGRR
jgi:hypothetical protein